MKFISLITLVLLIAACSNNFTPDQYETGGNSRETDGKSRVSVSIGGNARTILPVFNPEDFDKYTFEAANDSGTLGPYDMNGDSYVFDLEDGDWTITVKTYLTGIVDQDDKPIAVAGGSVDVTVSGDDIDTVVFINIPEESGTGTFIYSVLPVDAEDISVVLIKVGAEDAFYTSEEDIIADGDPVTVSDVPSGIYLSFVTANGKSEVDVVHIYNGQTTIAVFELEFKISDSSTYPSYYEPTHDVVYNLLWSCIKGSFEADETGEILNYPLVKSGSASYQSINNGINVINRSQSYDALDIAVTGDYSLSGDPGRGFGLNTAENNYKVTIRGNAIGDVPAGAVMQLTNNETYATLASSTLSAEDKTFELVWEITQVFTNKGIRIQTNAAGAAMSYRVNLIVVEDMGEREPPAGASGGDKDDELNADYVPVPDSEKVFSLAEWITDKNTLSAPLTNSGGVEIALVNKGINIGTRAQDYQTLELNFKGANGIPNMVLSDNIYKVTVYGIVLGDASTGEVRLQEPGGSYTTFVKHSITASADQTFKLVWEEVPANYGHNQIRIGTGNTYPIRITLIEVEKTGERPLCECTDCDLYGKKVSQIPAGTYCTCADCSDDCYVCTAIGEEPDSMPAEDTSAAYVPPSDEDGFFYLDLNDTKSFHAAGGSSTARPIIISSADKVDFIFSQNNQFLWIKLTSAQIDNILSADIVKIDLKGTASLANSNFRYYLGYQAGSNWNATDAQGAGTISSLNGDKTMNFVTDRKNSTFVQYLVLRYDGSARTDVSIESIKVTYGTETP